VKETQSLLSLSLRQLTPAGQDRRLDIRLDSFSNELYYWFSHKYSELQGKDIESFDRITPIQQES